MIHGYRMAGPPPHGEPPQEPPPAERKWPVWLGFAALVGAFMTQLAAQIVILIAAGTNAGDKLPEGATLVTQFVSTLVFIGAALVAAALVKPLHPWQFGLRRTPLWPAVGWAALAMVAFWVLLLVYSALITTPDQTTADDLGADTSTFALIAVGFLVVVMAPIAEELFFRALFYGALRSRLRPLPAALIAGTVFGLLHANSGIEAVPPLIVLGVILCLLYEKTGSLYPCIALHAFNNTLAYIGQTKVEPVVAGAFGAAVIGACVLLPRFAWRRGPALA
jgi:hypothetical protein